MVLRLGAWFHFMCKNLEIQADAFGNPSVAGNRSQADWQWIKSGFFLKWGPVNSVTRKPSVTCICFAASAALEQRFQMLLSKPHCDQILKDPYVVFGVILEQLFVQMDSQVWNVLSVFRQIEQVSSLDRRI